MKKFAIGGVFAVSLAVSGCSHMYDHCWHHCEPVMVKGFAATAEAPAPQVQPAADWK